MTEYEKTFCTPDTLTSDLALFHALFLSVVRFAVEKYGGSVETDPITGTTYVDIPLWAEEVCLEELGELVGPGKPLNAYLPFLQG